MTSATFRRSAIALAIVALAGCSTWDSMTKTSQATTVGAASGAVGGAVVAGPVGAVAGGAIGGIAGHEMAKSDTNANTSNGTSTSSSSTSPNSSYSSSYDASRTNTTASSSGAGASTGVAANAESQPTSTARSSNSSSDARNNSMAMNNPSSSTGKSQGTHMMSRDQYLREVQQSLNDQGYDSGKVDGKWGPKTAAAVKKFQADHGLTANGQIDSQTISALGITQPAESNTMGSATTSEKTASAPPEKTAANSTNASSQ